MPPMDEFKEQREAIKNADFKTKLKYFLYYYKWHTVVAISATILLIVLIHDIVTQKEDIFFATMLNCDVSGEENYTAFQQAYAEYAEIDTEEYDIKMDYSINFNQDALTELTMSATQRLMVYTAAGELDIIVGGSDIFPEQANQGMFSDLRDILTEEQLTKYEPYFYYVDQAIIDEWYEIADTNDPYAVYPDMPDPLKPEEMGNPIPVGLLVTDCDKLTNTYYFNGDYTALGIMVNAPHLEHSLKFIDYLFEEL